MQKVIPLMIKYSTINIIFTIFIVKYKINTLKS